MVMTEIKALYWPLFQELVEEPALRIAGSSKSDVLQGQLGDCWFLSACAAVANMQKVLDKVNPALPSEKRIAQYWNLILIYSLVGDPAKSVLIWGRLQRNCALSLLAIW